MCKVNPIPANVVCITMKSYRQVINLRHLEHLCLGIFETKQLFIADDEKFIKYPNLLIKEPNKTKPKMNTRFSRPIYGRIHVKTGSRSPYPMFSKRPNLLFRDTYPSAKLRKILGFQFVSSPKISTSL